MLFKEIEYEGGIRAFARLSKIDAGHISRVVNGKKVPGPRILEWFGLREVVRYEQSPKGKSE